MEWPIKRSLVEYVRGAAGGTCTCAEGAAEIMPGNFRFQAHSSTFDRNTVTGILRFRGTLHFRGHHGMLSVVIADPWLECTPGGTVVSIIDPARLPDRRRRKVFATLGPAALRLDEKGGTLLSWADPRPRLHDWGAMLFHDAYAEGTELDPVRVRIS
jgi:hypothetical protein